MKLDDKALEIRNSNGNIKFFDNVGFAIPHLLMAGLLERPKRAVYVISKNGQTVVSKKLNSINSNYLKSISEAYRIRVSPKKHETSNEMSDAKPSDLGESPEDIVSENERIIRETVKTEILTNLQQSSPDFFEKVCLDLLLAMGYGYDGSSGKVTQHSRDGGVDGIIYADKLGLEKIYYQAKLYKDGTIGRPMVAQFIGDIDGAKGVFITNASFTKEAIDYSQKHKNLSLIDGDKLVELMYQHGVGVHIRKTYQTKEIDKDYFDELS
jgi:restriction system protein